jgi:DNA repair protein RadC
MAGRVDDRELLEVLIGRAAARSQRLPLSALLDADEVELAKNGLAGRARRRLLACAEVARRYQPRVDASKPITTPSEALAHVSRLRSLDQETLGVLLLDIRLSLVSLEIVAVGAVAHVSVDVREVFAPALAAHASAVVLVHNHPSGAAEPSPQDADFTRAMVEAGHVLSIDVIDHLIVTRRSYYSFRRAGRI